MLDWPSSFSAQLALCLFIGCLLLATITTLIAIFIIIRHKIFEKEHAKRTTRRAELEQMIHICREAPYGTCDDKTSILKDGDYGIVIEIAVDWLRPLIGDDATQLVGMLRFWGMDSHIDKCLSSGSLAEKLYAIVYCGYEQTPRTKDILLRFCYDQDTSVQLSCLRGLAKRGDVDYLFQALSLTAIQNVRSTLIIAEIFLSLGNKGVFFLIDLLHRPRTPMEQKIAALLSLGHLKAIPAVMPLLDLLNRPKLHPDIYAQTIAALGRIGDARAEAAILKALHDKHIGIKVQAIHAARKINCTSFVEALIPCLNDPRWWVRFRAAEALYEKGQDGLRALVHATRTDSLAGRVARDVMIEKIECLG